MERGSEGLKICQVFVDPIVFKQKTYCSVVVGVKNLVIFCGRRKWITLKETKLQHYQN